MDRSDRDSLVNGLTELDTFITTLDLDSAVQSRATEIYRKAAQEGSILSGRGIQMVTAGCIILAARESNTILDIKDVVDITDDHIQKKTIHRTTKDLRNKLDLGFVLEDPHNYIDPIGDDLNASPHDRKLVETIIDIVLEDGIASGKKAQSIAGSAYYLVAIFSSGDGEFTQNDVARAADVTEVTIRNTYRDFGEVVTEQLDDEFDPNKHRSTP